MGDKEAHKLKSEKRLTQNLSFVDVIFHFQEDLQTRIKHGILLY